MLFPHLKSTSTHASFSTQTSPPPGTRDARDIISGSVKAAEDVYFKKSKMTKAQRAGCNYEKWIYRNWGSFFGDLDGGHFFQQPFWFRTLDDPTEDRLAIPDAFILQDEDIYLFEIKKTHCTRAWYQLFHLYRPILQDWYGNKIAVHCLEVVGTYDATLPLPGPHRKLDGPLESLEPDELGVLYLPRNGKCR
jgi:hypothetical protein